MSRLACFCLLAFLVGLLGCGRKEAGEGVTVSDKPVVRVVTPSKRTIVRLVGQPSFTEAFEQTAIYPKMTGYLEKWNVDIGDMVKPGTLLATIFVPELVEEQKLKKAQHELDQEIVKQSEKLVRVAQDNLKAATAQVKESQANVGKYKAAVDRWDSEVRRLTGLSDSGVVDSQVLLESRRQLKSNQASMTAAQANVETSQAQQLGSQASLEKSQQDVKVAQARVAVSKADVDRLGALVGYLKLTAPYAGVVISRNANTGDFVLPATGDPSAPNRSSDQSSTRAAPIFVIARLDKVRIFVDVPEADAVYIHSDVDRAANPSGPPATPASVRIRALSDRVFQATVTRSSWALNNRTRTLRAEVDLPNTEGLLRPGMYAIGELRIERPNVLAVPASTVAELGDEVVCFRLVEGKAVRTPVRVGPSDGSWVELLDWRDKDGTWQPFTGKEQILDADISELNDGIEVKVVP
ncbi:MAG: efflux RND transporter periplasmic adaptor subunit [Gemmataceae bacterium]